MAIPQDGANILCSGGSKGGARDAPPSRPKFLYCHAVFGKNEANSRLAPPPLGLAHPPLGNPGSATVMHQFLPDNMPPAGEGRSHL